MLKRTITFLVCFCLIFEQAGFAQVAPSLGVPAYLSGLAPVADRFRPIQLRSIEFDPASSNVQLLLDKGDLKAITPAQTETSSKQLFEYFQIGLTLPNSMFWVNLRPDSPENVIDPDLEKTDLGKILLEADLQLKKDVSRFTSPDTAEGRQYWDKLYAKAEALYGSQDCEIPTLTRPWIVPGEIIIRESEQGAFIYKATLKVMLEQDYLKDSPFYKFDDPKLKEINEYSSELIRQLIIPRLTREVNSSKRYAELRQVYYSLVLAQWAKSKFNAQKSPVTGHPSHVEAGSLFSKIDTKDLNGLTSKQKWTKEKYYKAYQKSFQQGEYSKEETVQSKYGLTVRQYFSGGVQFDGGSLTIVEAYSPENLAMAGAFLELTVPLNGNPVILDAGLQQSMAQDGGKRQPATQQDGGTKEFSKGQDSMAVLLTRQLAIKVHDAQKRELSKEEFLRELGNFLRNNLLFEPKMKAGTEKERSAYRTRQKNFNEFRLAQDFKNERGQSIINSETMLRIFRMLGNPTKTQKKILYAVYSHDYENSSVLTKPVLEAEVGFKLHAIDWFDVLDQLHLVSVSFGQPKWIEWVDQGLFKALYPEIESWITETAQDGGLVEDLNALIQDAARSVNLLYPLSAADQKLYLMNNHGSAVAAWEKARLEGRIPDNGILVHIDWHDDFGTVAVPYERPARTEDLRQINFNVDDFIAPACCRGLIREIYWVKPKVVLARGDSIYYAAVLNMKDGEQKIHFGVTRPEAGQAGFEDVAGVEGLREIKVHEISIEDFPDLKEQGPLIVDIDIDFFANKFAAIKGPGNVAEAVGAVAGAIKKNTVPGVITLALSQGITTERYIQPIAAECIKGLLGTEQPMLDEPLMLAMPFEEQIRAGLAEIRQEKSAVQYVIPKQAQVVDNAAIDAGQLAEQIDALKKHIADLKKQGKARDAVLYIDVDNTLIYLAGVVFSTTDFRRVRQLLDQGISDKDLLEECAYFLDQASKAGMAKFVPGIVDVLLEALTAGVEVKIITNRPSELAAVTRRTLAPLLYRVGLTGLLNDIEFLGDRSKAEFISRDMDDKQKKEMIFIDDQGQHTESVSRINSHRNAKVFDLPTEAWEFDFQDYMEETQRLLNDQELADEIRALRLELVLQGALLSLARLEREKQNELLADLLRASKDNHAVENLFAHSPYLVKYLVQLIRGPMKFPEKGISQTPLSQEQAAFLEDKQEMRPRRDDPTQFFFQKTNDWGRITTPLSRIEEDFGDFFIEGSLFEHIVTLAEQNKGRIITILDWGCGDGTALAELADALKNRGVRNVRLVGFGNMYFSKWAEVSRTGVRLILDDASAIEKYFAPGEIDQIYSFWGLNHLPKKVPSAEEKPALLKDYLHRLHALLAPGSSIAMTIYMPGVNFARLAAALREEKLFNFRISGSVDEDLYLLGLEVPVAGVLTKIAQDGGTAKQRNDDHQMRVDLKAKALKRVQNLDLTRKQKEMLERIISDYDKDSSYRDKGFGDQATINENLPETIVLIEDMLREMLSPDSTSAHKWAQSLILLFAEVADKDVRVRENPRDGGFRDFYDSFSKGEYGSLIKLDSKVLLEYLQTMYPECIAQDNLLGALAGFLKSKEIPADSVREIAAAKSLLAEIVKGNAVLFVLQSDNPFALDLFKIIAESVLTVAVSETGFLKNDTVFYKRQKEKIRNARFTKHIRTFDCYFWLNKDYVRALINAGGTTAILVQGILHELGHNLVEDFYPAEIWKVYGERRGGGHRVRYLRRAEEFLADKFVIDVSPKLGLSADAYMDFFEKIEQYRGIDDFERQHQLPRYLESLLRKNGTLQNFTAEDFRGRFLKIFSDDITSLSQWDPIKAYHDFLREYAQLDEDKRKEHKDELILRREAYFEAAREIQDLKIRENILWEILVELGLFKLSEKEEVFKGFREWLDAIHRIRSPDSLQQDGGAEYGIDKKNFYQEIANVLNDAVEGAWSDPQTKGKIESWFRDGPGRINAEQEARIIAAVGASQPKASALMAMLSWGMPEVAAVLGGRPGCWVAVREEQKDVLRNSETGVLLAALNIVVRIWKTSPETYAAVMFNYDASRRIFDREKDFIRDFTKDKEDLLAANTYASQEVLTDAELGDLIEELVRSSCPLTGLFLGFPRGVVEVGISTSIDEPIFGLPEALERLWREKFEGKGNEPFRPFAMMFVNSTSFMDGFSAAVEARVGFNTAQSAAKAISRTQFQDGGREQAAAQNDGGMEQERKTNVPIVKDILSSVGPSSLAQSLVKRGLIRKGQNVLSLGFGKGDDELFFVEQGCAVVATDNHPKMLMHLTEKAEGTPNLLIKDMDVSKRLAFNDEEFDIVYARLLLHYHSDSAQKAILSEIRRVLKQGGIAIIEMKSKDDIIYRGSTNKQDQGDGMFYFPDKDYSRNYLSIEELREKVRAADLEIVDEREYGETLYNDDFESALITMISRKNDGGTGDDALSGIDFRALPVAGQAVQAPAMMPGVALEMQQLAQNSKMQDLDKEWKAIEAQMRSSSMPYARLKEYIAVCSTRADARQHLDKTVCCILNILKLEEEQALATSQELKDLLVYIG